MARRIYGRGRHGPTIRVEVLGLKEMKDDLLRMDAELRSSKMQKVLGATMMPVKQEVRNNVPQDRGDLKDSVRITVNTDKRGWKADVRAGVPGPRGRYKKSGKKKPVYALQVEYGTEDTDAQPFLTPAIDGKEMTILKRFKRLLGISIFKWKNLKR